MFVELISSLSVTSCLVLFLVLAITLYSLTQKKRNLPPTPGIALPVIGHLYLMEKDPRKQFARWAKQLGSVFRLQMGSETVVVLNGYDVLKEAFIRQGEHSSDRPKTFYTRVMPDTHHGVIFANGENWKEQRKTSLAIMKKFGMGKNILAENISEEVSVYLDEIAKIKGKPKDLKNLTTSCVSYLICSILFGPRFEVEDPKFVRLMSFFRDLAKLHSNIGILNYVSVLQYLPFDPFRGKQLIAITYEGRNIAREMIREIKDKHNSDILDNFIVAYINEMEEKKKAGQPTHLDESNLSRTIDNFIFAGTETISTSILWCMLYLLHYPEVQAKIFKEIEDLVGIDRRPTMLDKPKLTYLNAVIMETQRIATITPLGIMHACKADVVVNGYTIPKGAQILPNLDFVLHDENVWGDPENFRPERFIDEKGNLVDQEELIPFSLGPRICLGENMAKMQLFLFLSALIQRFELLPADPKNIPPLKGVFGLAVSPEPFEIKCEERKK